MPSVIIINNQQPKSVEIKTKGKSIAVVAPISTSIPPAFVSSLTHLSQILDVDTSDANTGEVLVYDEVSQKYIVQTIPSVQGGIF